MRDVTSLRELSSTPTAESMITRFTVSPKLATVGVMWRAGGMSVCDDRISEGV